MKWCARKSTFARQNIRSQHLTSIPSPAFGNAWGIVESKGLLVKDQPFSLNQWIAFSMEKWMGVCGNPNSLTALEQS